jgi:thioredoxin 1
MIERLALVIVLALVGWAAYCCLRRGHVQRARAAAPTDPILTGFEPGTPAIVYFTLPTCLPCKTQQQPALQKLQTELGERVQVIQVDVTEQPDAAERWQVFSAPTTFILDAHGQPRQVNHGVATAEMLKLQLETLAS